jgi:autotransporter-associated beta strand protein
VSCIELAAANVVYWAPNWTQASPILGGTGTWDGSSAWLPSPNGTALTTWTNGDVAVFAGTGPYTVTLVDHFSAQPAAICFLGDGYTIDDSGAGAGTAGTLVLPANAAICVVAGTSAATATIEASVGGSHGLVANLVGGKLILGGANNYSGATSIFGGILLVGAALALPGSTDLTLSAAILDLNGQSTITIGGLNGNGTVTNSSTAASTLDVDQAASTTSTFTGNIQDGSAVGNVAIALSGAGTVTLSPTAAGGNTFSGGTVVTGGTLQITTSSGLADGSYLSVGANAASLFAAGPQQQAQLPISRLPVTTGDSSGSGFTPVTSQVLRTRLAQGGAIIDTLANIIDPTNQTHSTSVMLQTCAPFLDIMEDTVAANGGTGTIASNATVDAAILLVLQSMDWTATPNQNQWDGGAPNPSNDWFIAYYNAVLEFFATYDVSS